MHLDWQNLAVLLAVLSAGVYLGRAAWQSLARRKTAACGGCGNCSQASVPTQIVGTDALSQSAQTLGKPASAPTNASV
jgi:hypothetical protein